jgi:GT2 family glycosyltransferase
LRSLEDQDVDHVDILAGDATEATADFLAFVEPDDELEPGSLAAVAERLAGIPDADVLYTDEDRIDEHGALAFPRFKPGWSPDLLLTGDYTGGLLVVRRSLYERTGGWGWDLALRATEGARAVVHLPLVAYHRRREPASNVSALSSALVRRGEDALVEDGLTPGTFRVRRPVRGEPLVSIVVPFQDGAELLRRCLASLDHGGWDRWEALLVDNLSWEPATAALLQGLDQPRFRHLVHATAFNWAAINNEAARQAAGTYLLFLNADVAGTAPGWLRALLEEAQRPEVGPVGARLLYPDGTIQHAGVVLGLGGGVAWHAFCGCPSAQGGYLDQAKVVRNCSAVTGACLMVRRDVFDALGGFDESLAVAYNDVDFCLRAWQRGYRVVYTPFAELVHAESAFRGGIEPGTAAETIMTERWGDLVRADPFFNPNLDPMRSEFALRSS